MTDQVKTICTPFFVLTGNRYLAITDCYWMDDMARLLHEEFRPLGKVLVHLNSLTP